MDVQRVSVLVFVLVCGGAAIVARPLAQPAAKNFDQLYEEGQKRNASIKTLTARFTETTTSSLLTRPLVARGTVAVERPSRVMLRYSEPDTRLLLIDDKTLTTTWPTRQVLDIGVAMGRVQKQFVNGSIANLRHEFVLDERRLFDTPGAYFLSMEPKRKQIREALARLDLWVDRDSLFLKSIQMTFPGGETKTMNFEDIVPNAVLPPNAFVLSHQ
jgi:outer membrane lipoprotein-sorting protein